jgi:hypothetical protein
MDTIIFIVLIVLCILTLFLVTKQKIIEPEILEEGTDRFKEVLEEWDKEISEIDSNKLKYFIDKLSNSYKHDYGTICHAMAAAAKAGAVALDRSEQGGITGFQAGAVMWQFIHQWNYSSNKTGMEIIDYDKMLYPQYDYYFNDRNLSKDIWKALQKEASDRINNADIEYADYTHAAVKYSLDIDKFIQKFPDYLERPEYYNHLSMGTSNDWEVEDVKKKAGFEFAPSKPYEPINATSPVYKHWQDIVDGKIPFGYQLEEN